MFLRPSSFQEFLSQNGHIGEIYTALAKDDPSEAVTAALHVLQKTQNIPQWVQDQKHEQKSTVQRENGNLALQRGEYQTALMCYNYAILLAPNNSQPMVLAISNRSLLLQKLTAFKASLKDIETCLSMNCPRNVTLKLKKRRKEVQAKAQGEHLFTHVYLSHGERNLTCTPNNSEISCATKDIKAVGSGVPKIVAADEIKVGSILASEKAFVSYTVKENFLFTCYFCQKMSLNLIPCDKCCLALFCDEKCKKQCFDEYHKYECFIVHFTDQTCFGLGPNLMVKAAIKIRSKCKSWSDLITASNKMGLERIKLSSIKEIYDSEHIFSALSIKDDRPFVYNIKYDASFVCASIIHYLHNVPSFFPSDTKQKTLAVEAFGRIMMFLSVYIIPQKLIQVSTSLKTDRTNYNNKPNYGYFSFIGKLSNSCSPNVVTCCVNNQLTLLAIQGIKSGEEITIPYQRHWLETKFNRHERNVEIFLQYGTVCNCNLCSGDECEQQLSKSQKKFFKKINFQLIDQHLANINVSSVYKILLQALDVLKDVPMTHEYKAVYERFNRCKLFYESCLSDNLVV